MSFDRSGVRPTSDLEKLKSSGSVRSGGHGLDYMLIVDEAYRGGAYTTYYNRARTWELYSGLEYKGEVLCLPPGKYDDLGGKWIKRIGSFLCVQPSRRRRPVRSIKTLRCKRYKPKNGEEAGH